MVLRSRTSSRGERSTLDRQRGKLENVAFLPSYERHATASFVLGTERFSCGALPTIQSATTLFEDANDNDDGGVSHFDSVRREDRRGRIVDKKDKAFGGTSPMAPHGSSRTTKPNSHEAASRKKLLDSLQKSLAANRTLQSTVRSELARISRRKAENRAEARRCLQQRIGRMMSSSWRDERQSVDPPNLCSAPNRPFFSAAWNVERDTYDRHRPHGEPDPNPDAVRRGALLRGTLVRSSHPPWSFHESKALQQIVSHHNEKNRNASRQTVNYEEVAMQLAPAAAAARAQSRTARECELHHLSLQKRRPWTKAESLKLVELAFSGALAWTEIAEKLNDGMVVSNGHRNGPRTAWECFVQYQTKLRPKPPLQWTPRQDQLLLRYVAAAGPQCVWNSGSSESTPLVAHLSTALLPDKTRPQILHRIHHSLVNPKLSGDPWTADEERKLVVCLKMYHDYYCDADPAAALGSADVAAPSASASAAAVSKALNAIAEHHLGHRRSAKSATDKWKKSLDPGHSSLPFTELEDARLVQMAASLPTVGWAELCRLHFPSRHPERVAKRWAEIATNEQILEREGRTGGGGGGSAVLGSNSRKRKQHSGPLVDGSDPEEMFSAVDFYVQLKKT